MRYALVLAVAAGCSGGAGASGFTIDGNVVGTNAPTAGSVVVAWDVDAQPAYAYKFGEGTATATAFTLDLVTDPPAAAINTNGLAVGFVVLLPAGTQIADGMVDLRSQWLGDTTDYAIIWKSVTETQLRPWEASFGARYSCAHCIRSVSGSQPDSFVLVGCASVTIAVPATSACAWY